MKATPNTALQKMETLKTQPGGSRSNSFSSCPVRGTSFVPSPLIPSPPRSKTSDDDLTRKLPAQNKTWQIGVSTSARGSSTCTFFPLFFLFSHLNFTRLTPQMAQNHFPRDPKPAHCASTCTPSYPNPALPRPISYAIAFTPSARTVVDRTVQLLLLAITLVQPATDPPITASSASCPALAEAALGRCGRTDWIAADVQVLHRQRRREVQGKELGSTHEPRRALKVLHIYLLSTSLAATGHTLLDLWITLITPFVPRRFCTILALLAV
jgi:hypothetical protein